MNLVKTDIPDLVLVQPDVFPDERGYFFESFQEEKYRSMGIDAHFVQDNESKSVKNVLRGLHFQLPPYSQAKLVRVVRGSVQDVVVDLRDGSPAFGRWFSTILTEKEKNMMFIPEGFAHGFLTLEDDTIFQYKCSQYYHRESERVIIWNDPALGIRWLSEQPMVSAKDRQGGHFEDFLGHFSYNGK